MWLTLFCDCLFGSEIDFDSILDNGEKRQAGAAAPRPSLGSDFGNAASLDVESPGRQFSSLTGVPPYEPVPFHLTKYKDIPAPTAVAPSVLQSTPALDNYFGQSAMFAMGNDGPFDQGSTYPPLYL